MALELRRIAPSASSEAGPSGVYPAAHHPAITTRASTGYGASPCGYAIYVYRSGRWELEADLSAPGFEPSAPGLRGAYEGQVIKKESAPSADR